MALGDQDGTAGTCFGRSSTVDNEDLIRIGLEQHQDAIGDRDALIDPVTIGFAVFVGAVGRNVDDSKVRQRLARRCRVKISLELDHDATCAVGRRDRVAGLHEIGDGRGTGRCTPVLAPVWNAEVGGICGVRLPSRLVRRRRWLTMVPHRYSLLSTIVRALPAYGWRSLRPSDPRVA